MPFNNERSGIQNEHDFIREINGKKIKQLNMLFQMFIYDLYGKIENYNDVIYAWKNPKPQKTDFFVRLSNKNEIKRISVKKGVKNSVHVEPIMELVHFLIQNNVPKHIIEKLLKYHYADSTTNGTGKVRLTAEEYKKTHQHEIDEINDTINQENILTNAIDRFIVKGKNSEEKIDMIIYGVPDDFIWIKAKDIYRLILSKKDLYSTAVHFGPLTCQPLNRCINRNPLYEKKRYCIQIKWYNLCDDIIENMNYNIVNKIK